MTLASLRVPAFWQVHLRQLRLSGSPFFLPWMQIMSRCMVWVLRRFRRGGWLLCREELIVLSAERYWTEPVRSEVVPQPVHEIQVFAQCLTGRLLVFRVPEQVMCSTLVSTLSILTGVPAQLFYLTLDGRRLSHDSETVVHIVSGQTVRMHGRLPGWCHSGWWLG